VTEPTTPTGKRLWTGGVLPRHSDDILAIENEARTATASAAYVIAWDDGREVGRSEVQALADQLAGALRRLIEQWESGAPMDKEPCRIALAAYEEARK